MRDTLKKIGYDAKEKGIDYRTCNVVVALEEQSPDIAQSVVGQHQERTIEEIGAGDQVRQTCRRASALVSLSLLAAVADVCVSCCFFVC